MDSNTKYTLLHSVTETTHKKYWYAIQKHHWCKKSKAKSEAPVTSIFCMWLKDVISGRGQGLLGFNHFVYAAIYNHVQTNRNNACRQTIETWTTKRTNCSTWLWSTFNPFTAVDAIWRLEFITHADICLTFADKYFYASQHSMLLFWNRHAHRVAVTRITGAFADYCAFVT